jgi:hypothetical protein
MQGDMAVIKKRSHAAFLVLAGLFAIIFAGGCGRSGPAVAYVEGTVVLDGEPVAGASVGFSPLAGGQPAFGKTDAAGVFHLTTVRGGARDGGAVVGEYAVTITKWRNRMEGITEPNPALEAELAKLPPDYIVPKAYGDKATSGLKATVKPGRNVGPEFRYELKGDFKGG